MRGYFRRSNRSLYLEACRRKSDGVSIGPTPHQARLQAAGDLDALFLADFLVEQVHSTNAYSTAYLARHLPRGQVLLLRCYAEEFCLDAESYRSLTQQVSVIDSPLVTQSSDVFEHRGRLCVARSWVMGESLSSIVSRKERLPPKVAIELCLRLLRTLSRLDSVKLTGLRPSQIIFDPQGIVHLVDLDETELVLFRRKTTMRMTNMSPLSSHDRSFLMAQVTDGRVAKGIQPLLFSVGRLLGYMVSGDWRPSTQQKHLTSCDMDGLDTVVQWLCGDSEKRTISVDDAIARLQLYLPENVEANTHQWNDFQPQQPPITQPRIRTANRLLLLSLVGMLLAVVSGIGYITMFRAESTNVDSPPEGIETVESFDQFTIP